MGVYIKGIEMPKNCFDCEIFGLCSLKDRLEHIEDRNPDCPLVEIPTPHGRLIDEGTFICRMDDSFRMAGLNGADYRKVKRWLKNARTILEAEE